MKNLFKTSILFICLMCNIISGNAQNSGPNAPEAMSFEPVDVTDMVNLATGDMSYNIPIINIPGPSGGFPLSLSYHGGIAIDQESSWVGLGWNINPGAINRSISGFPDDWSNKIYFEYIFDPGGSETYESIGVSIPLWLFTGGAAPTIGLNYSWGAKRGFGGSVGFGLGEEMGASVGFQSDGSISVGVGFGLKNSPLSVNVGVTISADDISITGGLGIKSGKLGSEVLDQLCPGIGIGWSSKGGLNGGISSPVSFTNFATTVSENDWTISQSSTGFSLVFISYSKTTVRYWLFKQEIKCAFGTLYSNLVYNGDGDGYQKDNINMDVHSVSRSYDSFLSPDKSIFSDNAVLPSPDVYQVSGQGLTGTIQPRMEMLSYIMDERYQIEDEGKEAKYKYNFGGANTFNVRSKLNFYFNGENVTDFKANDFNIASYTSTESLMPGSLFTSYDPDYYKNFRQVTGNYVEYFTNEEIMNAHPVENNTIYTKGFIETQSKSLYQDDAGNTQFKALRNKFPVKGIGAFAITTADGKTYHYSLPVYQYEEIMRNYNSSNKVSYSEQRRFEPYAYTWLLTAITGPDYIDRGGDNGRPNGIIDNNDYGFWVKFDYGKWTDGYIWQLPAVNPNKEKPYHIGRKQIYYLNSISTKTHTAYFLKSLREDGKGNDGSAFSLLKGTYIFQDEYLSKFWFKKYYNQIKDEFILNRYNHPIMKLDKIVITKNDNTSVPYGTGDGTKIGSINSVWDIFTFELDGFDIEKKVIVDTKLHNVVFYGEYHRNMIETNNVPSSLYSNCLQVINFSYDYSLNNKLTLTAVQNNGRNNEIVLPPYIFSYKNDIIYNNQLSDLWGFYGENKNDDQPKPDVDALTLNSILTPVGTKIDINYESDTYQKETVFNGHVKNVKHYLLQPLSAGDDFIRFNIPVFNDPNPRDLLVRIRIKGIYLEGMLPKKFDVLYGEYCSVPESQDLTNKTITIKFNKGIKAIVNEKINKIVDVAVESMIFDQITYVIDGNITKYGGGLRVKSLKTSDPATGNVFETEYTYFNGLTPYAYHNFDFFVPYFSEIPNPSVVYSQVEVKNKSNGNYTDDVKKYTFYNYDNLIDIRTDQYNYEINHLNQQPTNASWYAVCKENTPNGEKRNTYNIQIVDAMKLIGTLKETTIFNKEGHELKKTKYAYRKNNEIQESFLTNKQTTRTFNIHNFNFPVTKDYSFCTSKVSQNFVLDYTEESSNGRSAKVEYLKYDPITGSAIETRSIGINGDEVKSKVAPAYTKYAAMGSKVLDPVNKNMLTQTAATYTEKLIDGVWKPIGAEVQTWNNRWDYYDFNDGYYINYPTVANEDGVWRKHHNFVWKGEVNDDGSYKNFQSFNFDVNPTDNISNGWQRTNTITRYNHYSTALESRDINGNHTSTRTGNQTNLPISVAANSTFFEATHCGFEEAPLEGSTYYGFDGGFYAQKGSTSSPQRLTSGTNSITSHTGNYYLKLNGYALKLNLDIGPCCLKSDRKYLFSAWIHKTTINAASLSVEQFSGSTGTTPLANDARLANTLKQVTMGDWVLVTHEFMISPNATKVTLNIYGSSSIIDDVRLQPKDGGLNAYTYDDAGNVTAILDNNNFATKYEYDAGGRLIATYKETPQGFKKTSSQQYNYQRSFFVIDYTYSGVSSEFGVAQTLTFNALPASSGATYTWDFGDGTTGTGQNVSHTYPVNNPDAPRSLFNPTVTLTVKETDGKITKKSKTFNFPYLKITSPGNSYTLFDPNRSFDLIWDSNAKDGFFEIHSDPGYIDGGYVHVDYKTRSYRVTLSSSCPVNQTIPITISYYQNNLKKSEVTLEVFVYKYSY